MRTLHNDDVKIGDTVYDLAMGDGKVTSLTVDTFGIVVTFSGNRQYAYDGEGRTRRFLRPTLYWADPMFMPPVKMTQATARMIKGAVRGMIKEMTGSNG